MPRPTLDSEAWYLKAAELMARDEKLSLRQAAELAGVSLTVDEATNVSRRKGFQKALWNARHAYAKEVASNPGRNKEALIGKLEIAASKLLEEGQWKQAAEVLMALAKAEGWLGPESNVNVFGGLSANDFEVLRGKLEGNVRKRQDSSGAGAAN